MEVAYLDLGYNPTVDFSKISDPLPPEVTLPLNKRQHASVAIPRMIRCIRRQARDFRIYPSKTLSSSLRLLRYGTKGLKILFGILWSRKMISPGSDGVKFFYPSLERKMIRIFPEQRRPEIFLTSNFSSARGFNTKNFVFEITCNIQDEERTRSLYPPRYGSSKFELRFSLTLGILQQPPKILISEIFKFEVIWQRWMSSEEEWVESDSTTLDSWEIRSFRCSFMNLHKSPSWQNKFRLSFQNFEQLS